MLQRYINHNSNFKILHGNDTDVTWFTIVRFHDNSFIVTRTFDNEFDMTLEPKSEIWTANDLKHQYELQYGTPMHYMSEEDYEWLISKNH